VYWTAGQAPVRWWVRVDGADYRPGAQQLEPASKDGSAGADYRPEDGADYEADYRPEAQAMRDAAGGGGGRDGAEGRGEMGHSRDAAREETPRPEEEAAAAAAADKAAEAAPGRLEGGPARVADADLGYAVRRRAGAGEGMRVETVQVLSRDQASTGERRGYNVTSFTLVVEEEPGCRAEPGPACADQADTGASAWEMVVWGLPAAHVPATELPTG
jgi:hypothetical protein